EEPPIPPEVPLIRNAIPKEANVEISTIENYVVDQTVIEDLTKDVGDPNADSMAAPTTSGPIGVGPTGGPRTLRPSPFGPRGPGGPGGGGGGDPRGPSKVIDAAVLEGLR